MIRHHINPIRRFLAGFATLSLSLAALAGNLDNASAPALGSGMPTLEGIYTQLGNGTAATVAGSFQEPGAGPTVGTGHTLSDIQTLLPALDANGALAADVLSGKTFWGLTNGQWGLRTGTMPIGGNVTGANGALSMTIPAGSHDGSKTATASDTNLVSGNIRSGVSIFGVSGATNVVDTTTATPAAPSDIAAGKTAYVNGALVTGTSSLATAHVASAICAQGWGGADCSVCAGQWSGTSCNVCPSGWSGTDCDIISKPFTGGAVPTYSSTPWNCVLDTATGLTWENKTTDGGLRDWGGRYTWYNTNPDSNGGNSGSNTDSAVCSGGLAHCDTQNYIAAVNGARLCGYTDWRLPTLSELEGINTHTDFPTIDTAYFPNTIGSGYWSGTSVPADPASAWFIYFSDANTYTNAKSFNLFVRLVRGGQ